MRQIPASFKRDLHATVHSLKSSSLIYVAFFLYDDRTGTSGTRCLEITTASYDDKYSGILWHWKSFPEMRFKPGFLGFRTIVHKFHQKHRCIQYTSTDNQD